MIRSALAALCCMPLIAAVPKPVVRSSIESPRPIVVGQAVRVNVTVFVPNYFTGAPEFPQLNLDNAIVVLPQETPKNTNETIGGQVFAGIGVTYLIYPQQPGAFHLPRAEVTVKYAPNPPQSIEARLPLPSVAFEAVIPPEAAELDYFLPTTSLVITQKFDKPLQNLRIGDTVTRTVTITASRLRAMLIPPVQFQAPDGIVIYPKQPSVNDIKTDRGEFVEGKRLDSVTYLIRKQGDYALPDIEVKWWDLAARKVRTAALPSTHVIASPNPGYKPELAPEPEPVRTAPSATKPGKHYLRLAEITAALFLALGFLLWIWLRFGMRLLEHWHESRRAYKDSEVAHFARLRKACRAGNAKDAYSVFLSWSRRFRPGVGVDRFLSEAADDDLTGQVASLTSTLYRHSTAVAWSGDRMIGALERLRSRHEDKTPRSALPPLNPGDPIVIA
jgi:hypothetical protein